MAVCRNTFALLLLVSFPAAGCSGGAHTLAGDAVSETAADPVPDAVTDHPGDQDEPEPPPPQGWARAFHVGDETWPNAAAAVSDGGFVVAGETLSPTTEGLDITVLRLDAAGSVVFCAVYEGRADEHVTDMRETLDGGFVVVGAVTDASLDTTDMMALKLDRSGEIIWQFTYGSSAVEWAHDVEVSSDGGYVLVGEANASPGGSIDMAVVRLDAGGNITWQRLMHAAEYGWAISVDETTDGSHIVAGETYTPAGSNTALWVLKVDGSGNILFQNSYEGEDWSDAGKVLATADGGALVAGHTRSFGAGGYDFWILKLDAEGGVQWQKAVGGLDDEMANAAALVEGGGLVVAGPTYSFGAGNLDILAVGLDAGGNVLWLKTYGGPLDDYATYVLAAADGGLGVVGPTGSFGLGVTDAWVLKTDASGRLPDSCPESLGQDAALVETPTHVLPASTGADPRPGTMALRVLSLTRRTPDVPVDTQCE